MNKYFGALVVACGLLVGFEEPAAFAAMYNYQLYPGNGVTGPVGNGSLAMSNSTTTIYANIHNGMGSFDYNLVIFIDSVPGGFTDTSQFRDNNNFLETAVSGYKVLRSTAFFAPGFEADYAIAVSISHNSGNVYQLVNDASGPHLQLVRTGVNLQYANNPSNPNFVFQFDWADIGLPGQRTNFFKFESSYISDNGSRTLQSYEGLIGNPGYDVVTFTNYDTYGVQPVPENTNAALAAFGGIVCSVACVTRLRQRRLRRPVT